LVYAEVLGGFFVCLEWDVVKSYKSGKVMKNKKIAIFHNYMDNIGGAEYVDLVLARELNADIYTTNISSEKIKKMGFSDVLPRIYSIGKIPVNAPYRQEMAYRRFRKLNVAKDFGRKYDMYFIGGDWAMSGARLNKPNLWYVYSPIREIYDLYEYTRKNNVPFCLRFVFDLWVKYHHYMDKRNVKHVDKLVCISENVRGRVKKYLDRDSSVIYPPTETVKFKFKKGKRYWLSVNRLITHKRVDMQMKAFAKLPNERLIVVGCYEKSKHFQEYASYINKIKPSNVEIKSWVTDSELVELYSNCKGVICTSKDEDYGMSPVEGMASGKPVIAVNEGGYKETVVDGVTGKLINVDVASLVSAVKGVGKDVGKYKGACLKRAEEFDVNIFIAKIKEELRCHRKK
jgi:glycosyltransferase involved in cell wall biosynthesis